MARDVSKKVIGIDASRMGIQQRTGTENYSHQIIRHLLAEDVPWDWRLYLNGQASTLPRDVFSRAEIRDIPARQLWTHARLSREMLTGRPSVLFVPAHVVPIIHPRTVVTIHDLGYLHVPDAHPPAQRRMLDLTTRWSAAVAHHIIVPSAQTQHDLIERYHVPEDNVTVVHHGVDDRFYKVDSSHETNLRERYGLTRPYVLAVGTIQPRKNLSILAEAMSSLDACHDLVIAGKRGWLADQVLNGLDSYGLGDRLHLLNYVPDEDLPNLYAGSDLFVQPSRFEGFGMPVLEAMAVGTPVLCAGGSSLIEIGGEAAEFFVPDDLPSLISALQVILESETRQTAMKARGSEWSSKFTWEQAAVKTRIILSEALT